MNGNALVKRARNLTDGLKRDMESISNLIEMLNLQLHALELDPDNKKAREQVEKSINRLAFAWKSAVPREARMTAGERPSPGDKRWPACVIMRKTLDNLDDTDRPVVEASLGSLLSNPNGPTSVEFDPWAGHVLVIDTPAGQLSASFFGDADNYFGMGVDFKRDSDDQSIQCALVEYNADEDALKAMIWDGSDQDSTFDTEIALDGNETAYESPSRDGV